MKRLYMFLLCVPLLALPAGAETQDVVVTINGKVLTQQLVEAYVSSRYNFGVETETVNLVFIDAEGKRTVEEYHPTTVQLWFNADPNGIEGIRLYNAGNQDGKLSLGGIKPGTPVRVYDTAGRMRLATTAGKEHALIGLESLPHGIYIIRAGDTAIKFTKK